MLTTAGFSRAAMSAKLSAPFGTGRVSTTSVVSGAPSRVVAAVAAATGAGCADRGTDTNTPTSTPTISASTAVVRAKNRVMNALIIKVQRSGFRSSKVQQVQESNSSRNCV